MLLTDAAIALSRSRCRPNRGLHSHLSSVCVSQSLSAMRRNGNKKTNNNNNSKKRREEEQQGLPNHVAAMAAFAFMADTPIYKKDLQ